VIFDLLPEDPDYSAQKIRNEIFRLTEKKVAVIIIDSMGRPLRNGIIAGAIGVSGIKPLKDFRGKQDLFGYTGHKADHCHGSLFWR